MTLGMLLWHQNEKDNGQRRTLPPTEIVSNATGVDSMQFARAEAFGTWSLVAHFGFGAAMGAIYALLPAKVRPASPIFGLGVWAVSYAGVLPATGVIRPAWHDHPRRNLFNIAVHLLWGWSLGRLYHS